MFIYILRIGVHEIGCQWGFTVLLSFNRKDVRLPVQMQRAMAAEAESNRMARAKVSG